MKLTEQTLLQQMQIDEVEIQRRREIIRFCSEDERTLASLEQLAFRLVDEMSEEFYSKLTEDDDVVQLIGDSETLERLRVLQRQYILSLFSGNYGLDYVNSRLRIGMVHKRIGVEPKLFISAVHSLLEILRQVMVPEIKDAAVREKAGPAIEKILFFDMTLVFDTYIRSVLGAVELARDRVRHYAEGLEEKVAERTRLLDELARMDPLTGLHNIRSFKEFLERDLMTARRNEAPLCLLYFDVDKFKAVNDTFGHQRGDEVLKSVADALRIGTREVDLLCRYGGDEFCVLLQDCTAKDGEVLGRRIWEEFSGLEPDLSPSMGIAQTGPDDFDSAEVLLTRADEKMYQAKKTDGFKIET